MIVNINQPFNKFISRRNTICNIIFLIALKQFVSVGLLCFLFIFLHLEKIFFAKLFCKKLQIIEIKAKIGENCSLSSGSIVGGLCRIGRNVSLGARSTIVHKTNIGKNNIIKSGDVIEKDISDIVRDEETK